MIWDRFTFEVIGGAVLAGGIVLGVVLLWILAVGGDQSR